MKPNHPAKLPIKVDYGVLARLLGEARDAVGELRGLQKSLKNPFLLMTPLTTKEAAVSSKIEGTQSTAKDVFIHEAGANTRFNDVIEVVNYKKAMLRAIDQLEARPMNLNLIREIHSILLHNTRGDSKKGEFRKDQVWIGTPEAPIEKATYIPPEWNLIPEYMDNLERYLHFDNEDPLIQAALIHYQFEAIHPFGDGNGRIGRLLMPLFLYSKGLLKLPILYLSGYFEADKDTYLDSLHGVDKSGRYEPWIAYFLKSVIAQSRDTATLINKILKLYDELSIKTENLKSPYMLRLIEFMFRMPAFRVKQVNNHIHANRSTIIRLLRELEKLGYVKEIKGIGRGKLFIFVNLAGLL
jgi:Fic family protein